MALVSVSLRLLSRYERKQPLWWDDWMILFSMGWNLIVVFFIFGMIHYGMGLHADKVPIPDIVLMAKYLLVAENLYVYNLVWTKLSFLMMYYRIFRFPYFKRWAFVIGGFVIMWVITVTFLFVFICVPVQKLWYPDLPGHCINQVGTWIANATSTIVTDLAILILPIPQIWKLQLKRSEKIALTVIFSLGFFVVFASVYRFTVLFSYRASDPTYTLANTVGWTAIEMSAGITSACLPTIQPAIHFIARKLGLLKFIESSVLSRNGRSTQNGAVAPETTPRHEHPTKVLQGEGAFYRLSDRNGSAQSEEVDIKLRPEHGYVYTVSSELGNGNTYSSGDEIPLNRIGVQTDFKQTRN